MLAVLQNQDARLRFIYEQTLALLRDEFAIPGTWRSLAAWIDDGAVTWSSTPSR